MSSSTQNTKRKSPAIYFWSALFTLFLFFLSYLINLYLSDNWIQWPAWAIVALILPLGMGWLISSIENPNPPLPEIKNIGLQFLMGVYEAFNNSILSQIITFILGYKITEFFFTQTLCEVTTKDQFAIAIMVGFIMGAILLFLKSCVSFISRKK